MGSMFRSEEMALCQMFVQPEAAYNTISELGELGLVQFRDLNDGVTLFQRKFVNEVRRCDESERKLRFIEKEMAKNGINIQESMEQYYIKAPNPKDIIYLEARLEKTENELLELSQNEASLNQNYTELTELKLVLENANLFFTDKEVLNLDTRTNTDEGTHNQRGKLGFVAGVIERERVFAFERMLWRISRGNIFLKRADVSTPIKNLENGTEAYKSVFVAFFQGEQLNSRINKVCAGFHASLYPCPNNYSEREEMIKKVEIRLSDLNVVLKQTEDHRGRVLNSVCQEMFPFSIMIMKMKAIYHTLNCFNTDVTNKCLVAECWLPKADLQIVSDTLIRCSKEMQCNVESFINLIEINEAPPTFNRTNRFTQGFQNLVDSYGMSSYREANPALYTIITFPFLFAIMFGDMGHGAILALFGIWMVSTENKWLKQKSTNEIWNIFFGGRYIIMLMGLFSIYTGFIYNDLFAKSVNIFGSKWFNNWNVSTVMHNEMLTMDPASDTKGIYPMGLDPVWQLAPQNKIIFHNSFKMKLSIILGVSHMIFGVCMNLINYKHFRQNVNIVLEFLPKILFLVLLFGYLVFLMFFKWVKYSAYDLPDEIRGDRKYLYLKPGCAPSVLILFIEMMMMSGEGEKDPDDPCIHTLYENEKIIEQVFLIVAVLCIPWMLLAKPIYIQMTRKNSTVTDHSNSGSDNHDDEPMSEIWIHQAIHTIEYVLETISHTASYLRLWALSLAHAQLSDVLYNMVMVQGLHGPQYYGGIILFAIFGFWAVLTLGILVMMEGLSAFLHTLRLHWVEFMSKFYKGIGYAFEPFSMKKIVDGSNEE